MTKLNPDGLEVTSFDTAPLLSTGTVESDNCISPLCMTEGPECTTPWCPVQQPDTSAC
ncbi:MAG TPA: hypothetical protein VF771_05975 [Longimicrobiaceae bacterium]